MERRLHLCWVLSVAVVTLVCVPAARAEAAGPHVLLTQVGTSKTDLMPLAELTGTLLLGALRNRPALVVTSPAEVASLNALTNLQRAVGADPPANMLHEAEQLNIEELVTTDLVDAHGLRLVVKRVRVKDARVLAAAEEKLGDAPDRVLALAVGRVAEKLYPYLDFGGTLPRPARPMWLGVGAVGTVAAALLCVAGVGVAATLVAVLVGGAGVVGTRQFPWPVAALVTVGLGTGLVLGMLGVAGMGTGVVAVLVGG